MNTKLYRSGIILLVPMLGCVSVNRFVMPEAAPGPRVEPAQVAVYLEDDIVPESCKDVALLHGKPVGWGIDEAEILNKLREEAAEMGADAIYLRGFERVSDWLWGDYGARGGVLALRCADSFDDIAARGEVVIGMSMAQVRRAWGEPEKANDSGWRAEWRYDSRGLTLRFTHGFLDRFKEH